MAETASARRDQWSHITDWRSELMPHYEQAQRMLGVVLNRMTAEASSYQTYYAAYYGEVHANGNGNGAAPAKGRRGLRRRKKVKA